MCLQERIWLQVVMAHKIDLTFFLFLFTAKTMLCTFCHNKGIPPPHTHSVRHWILPNKPIICPELLSTKCCLCNLMGHTKLYCPNKTNTIETNKTNQKTIQTNQKTI